MEFLFYSSLSKNLIGSIEMTKSDPRKSLIILSKGREGMTSSQFLKTTSKLTLFY